MRRGVGTQVCLGRPVVVMGGVGEDEYLYPKEEGKKKKGSSSPLLLRRWRHCCDDRPPRGAFFIDKKGLKVGGGGARDGIFLTDSRLDLCFRDGEGARAARRLAPSVAAHLHES